jgi:hypothetical protein
MLRGIEIFPIWRAADRCQKWIYPGPRNELAKTREMAVQQIRINPPAFSLLKNFWNKPVDHSFLFMGFEVSKLDIRL